jgi:hypothetical protein
MTPQRQPESVPSDELDRWLEGEIREARRQANEAVRLLRIDQKSYQRGAGIPGARQEVDSAQRKGKRLRLGRYGVTGFGRPICVSHSV